MASSKLLSRLLICFALFINVSTLSAAAFQPATPEECQKLIDEGTLYQPQITGSVLPTPSLMAQQRLIKSASVWLLI